MPPDLTNTACPPLAAPFCRPEGAGDTQALLLILIILGALWLLFKWIKKNRNRRK